MPVVILQHITMITMNFRPTQKNLAAAIFRDDNQFYRAHVFYYDTRTLAVRYLDFGNKVNFMNYLVNKV